MEQILKKLINLADNYVVIAQEMGFEKNNHTEVRGRQKKDNAYWTEGKRINIYFGSSYETWLIDFDNINVVGYAKKITIPFNSTIETLTELFNDVNDYFENYFSKNVQMFHIETLKEKHKKIKELENELRKLKNLV
jgi:hypothetical protein